MNKCVVIKNFSIFQVLDEYFFQAIVEGGDVSIYDSNSRKVLHCSFTTFQEYFKYETEDIRDILIDSLLSSESSPT